MNILKSPISTEKMTLLEGKAPLYAFIVDSRANKLEIKTEVQRFYGVNVKSVNTMIYKPKRKFRYTKTNIIEGSTNSIKKAIVLLTEGEKIDFFASV